MEQNRDTRSVLDSAASGDKDSTLLPMLLGGLILIVIGAGVVMTIV
ncbi:hypothetical protein [Neoaquamicrobium sediminum]|uniref:Uncharacterized protein n=1 Tax=Neoaquamicrobium sediminum TaxID=1849104 RepID=A0ABV3X225_9HYPH